MDDSEILINGIDAATGQYLTPPLSPEAVSRLAQGEPIDPNLLADQKAKLWRETEQHFAPMEGIDANDLSQAGWGVIFAHDADPAVREALTELLEFRKRQAGRVKESYYREFTEEKGYRVGDPREGKRTFLARCGARRRPEQGAVLLDDRRRPRDHPLPVPVPARRRVRRRPGLVREGRQA